MDSLRKDIRISPNEFTEYKVRIDLDEITLEGLLGNVSESGLCVVMPHDSLVDEVGSHVTGAILSKSLEEYVDFQGTIVWSRQNSGKSGHYLSGVEFEEPIQLTNTLLLKSLTEG